MFNEQLALEGSIRRLHGFLTATFPFCWRIVIADNASTDGTLRIARRLSYELRPVEVHPPRREGPRPGAARGMVGIRCAGARLHGRRPLDRPGRAAAAGRAAALGPQRDRDRHAPGGGGARATQPQARADLARLQPAAASRPAGPVQRRPVRLQGDPRRRRRASCCRWSATRRGSSTPSCSCSRSAGGCGSTRCRSTGSRTPTPGSTSLSTALGDLRGVARLLVHRPRPRLALVSPRTPMLAP